MNAFPSSRVWLRNTEIVYSNANKLNSFAGNVSKHINSQPHTNTGTVKASE